MVKITEATREKNCTQKNTHDYIKQLDGKPGKCLKKCKEGLEFRNPKTFKCVSIKKKSPRVATPPVYSPNNIIDSISANDLPGLPISSQNTPINNMSESIRSIADLKDVCSDSNYCITFGSSVDKINEYFGHYIDLNYVNEISKLNQGVNNVNEGVNGFLLKLNYNRDNYAITAVLKSTMNSFSNNLGYEYLVGQFINKYN
jgi:hypothetical protein